MSVVTKRVNLTKVQALAATFVFQQLKQARDIYDAAERRAMAQFAEVLMDAKIDPAHVPDAMFEGTGDGAYIEYKEDDGIAESTDPVFEKPPATETTGDVS